MTHPRPALWGGDAGPECFLEVFRRRAGSLPDAPAVADGNRVISYAELWRWAAGVAGVLRQHDVGEGDHVGVSGTRSAEVIAAMLGVALLGAAYVPLDPEYPERRLVHMLHDSRAQVLLTAAGAPSLEAAAVTRIPVPPADRFKDATPEKPIGCRPQLPYYVIYTSGSTGWPKGVTIPHSCLDNMAHWQAEHSPRPDLRTAQFAPLNFDVWFQEVLGTLHGAGTVVVMPEQLRRDPVRLLRWLVAERIERLFLPYVALQMLAIAAGAAASLDELRLLEVNTAGEQIVCTPQIRALFGRLPRCRLVNHYGQSESAMVTSHILPAAVAGWPTLPPIGVPLPGCQTLIDPVDPEDPDVGELLVAGLPLSLGYLGQTELNARRFVSIPPTPHGQTQAFRTGDLVRLADGVLHFLSRLDTDVKIRGVRVNLLEVDAQLLEETGVKAAATVVLSNAAGSKNLQAAITVSDTTAFDSQRLLARLREFLPAESVPLSVSVMPELPRTPSGKIDRDAVAAAIAAMRPAEAPLPATTSASHD